MKPQAPVLNNFCRLLISLSLKSAHNRLIFHATTSMNALFSSLEIKEYCPK